MKPIVNYGLSDSLIDAVRKSVEEALIGGQKKLDVDKDGKLEKSDFASLRAKKNAVDTKPKLKEEDVDHIDEKISVVRGDAPRQQGHSAPNDQTRIDKTPTGGRIFTGTYFTGTKKPSAAALAVQASARERLKKMREEVEQMDEADLQEGEVKDAADAHRRTRMDQMSRHSTHDRERAHERHQAKLDSIHNNGRRRQDSMTDADIHGYKERMAYDTQRRKDDDEDTRKTFNVMRDRIKNRKSKNEDVEQMDELSVHKMLRYTDASNKNREVLNKKWDTGTATEREKNKVLSHEKGADRASTRIKAKTGKYPNEIGKLSRMKYAITKEDVEQMDEVKLADLPRRKVVGKSYGADYVDPEGADETAADMKKAEPKRKSGPQGTMKRRFIKDKSKLRMQYK